MKSSQIKHYFCVLFLSILAGISIGLGALAFIVATSLGAELIGSVLFSVGLLAVCSFGMYLYTGKIAYAIDNKSAYLLDLLVGFMGNFIGAAGFGLLCSSNEAFRNRAAAIATSRDILAGGESWYLSLILGIICGILVFLAVDMFKKKPGVVGTLGLVLAVTVFVFVGSEHCIANMVYFSMGLTWTWGLALNVLLVAIGNSIGALTFRGLLKLSETLSEK